MLYKSRECRRAFRTQESLVNVHSLILDFGPDDHCYDQRLLDCFASYFGSFTCVAFSDDNRFVVVSECLVDDINHFIILLIYFRPAGKTI